MADAKLTWQVPGPDQPAAVMGILNVTPDSFSDGGLFASADAAIERALQMAEHGADIVDVGGESTRPGAADVPADEELARTIPVIEGVRRHSGVALAVDTSKSSVMEAAVAAGANLINDVNALRSPAALATVARLEVPVCLMHMRGTPRTMQRDPVYEDVVQDVMAYLFERVAACESAGIERGRLILDPGFGFGKTVTHNLQLLHGLGQFVSTGLPVLAGLSRKSMLQTVTGRAVGERLFGSVALATLAVWQGARIVRVHDVAASVDAVKVAHATRTANSEQRG